MQPGEAPQIAPIPHGEAGIEAVGHRIYVGALWDEIGQLQFDFLVGQGLRPEHVLLDIACGALRGGVHFIPYLDAGNYLGIDKEPELIERGVRDELPADVRRAKRPEFVVSDRFDFERFSRRPDFALAQSLFTHLPAEGIESCLARLRRVAPPHCRLFATFFESSEHSSNPAAPHDHLLWFYTREEMLGFGRRTGWQGTYIGDWQHPREQVMVRYRPAGP